MLTVARVAAEHAAQAAAQGAGALEVLQAALDGARQALADTPNILPSLNRLEWWTQAVKAWSVCLRVFSWG